MSGKPKAIHLKSMPESIRKMILQKQTDEKIKCDCMRSMEWTIYTIIREWDEHRKQALFIEKNS